MRVVASVFIMSVWAVAAVAGESPMAALRDACKADVAQLCEGVQPGGGRIKECLKANKDKLSEGCRSAIASLIQARRAAKANEQAASQQPAPAPQ